MDSSDDLEEIEITDEYLNDVLLSAKLFDSNYLEGPLVISGIHKAVFEGNIHTVRLMVESGESVNEGDSSCGFTPLHFAVVRNNLDLVDYLLSSNARVNAKSQNNLTALHLAAELNHIEAAAKLLEAGADLHSRDSRGYTPLHISTHHPEMAHFLIKRGADVNALDYGGGTPLSQAYCVETVCMLLYYGADANISTDGIDSTRFTRAQYDGDEDIQRVLFEYVPDFSDTPDAVKFALGNDPTYAVEIINRGGDVNYGDYEGVSRDDSAFFRIAQWRECDEHIFKAVWDRITFNEIKKTVDLNLLFESGDLSVELVRKCLQVVIESDNIQPAVESFRVNKNFYLFIGNFAKRKMDLEQLTIFTCRLLEYGFRPSSFDVSVLFSFYGFCELFNILLYMDVDCSKGWPDGAILPRTLFDVGYKIEESEILDVKKRVALQLLRYFTFPNLMRKWEKDDRSNVPSLREFARDSARGHVWDTLGVKNVCHFYTAIDQLKVSKGVKKILAFKKKLYGVGT